MSTYIERLAVKNGDAIDTYKVVTDGQSFTRTCVGKNYYKITDTALANGCLIDLLVNNPSDGIDIYIYQNSTWYHFLNKSSVYGSNRTAYAKHICFNCGNGGRIFMHGETDSTDCEINSTRGITATKILFALSYGTIAVRRTCLDSTAVLYNSFEEVLEEVDVLSLISDINSVPYYNNDATNGYIIHSFVDKSTFDSTLSDYLHYSTVTSAYNSVSTTSADVLSTSTFLGKCSASDTACTLFTAKQIKTYVKNDDDATLKFTKCGNVAAYMEDLPGRGTTTVDIPIQQCGDYFGNEYTTVYSLTSEEMSNTAYFTR